jgi:hypothetical protein
MAKAVARTLDGVRSFNNDMVLRVVFTALAGLVGVAVVSINHIDKWWAVAIAAGVTVVRAVLEQAAVDPHSLIGPAFWDIAERTAWTAAQAALAVVSVDHWNLPPMYVGYAAAVLAAVKAYIASVLGEPQTASTLPAKHDLTARRRLDHPSRKAA